MSKFISKKTKRDAVRDYNTQGMTLRQVAEKYGVTAESVRRWTGYKTRPRGTRYSKSPVNQTRMFETPKGSKRAPFVNDPSFPNSNRHWTKTEDALLVDAVTDKLTVEETSKILGRSVPSVMSRKCLLIDRGLIKEDVRFPVAKGVKRVRKVVESPKAKVEVVKATKPEVIKSTNIKVGISDIALNDLAAMVKSYGVSVTVMVTENGTEVKMHN